MTDTLTIVGKVATDPVRSETGGGVAVTNFRVASSQRRFDTASQSWVEMGTNWYSVAAFRQLGEHAKVSLRSGDSVIVTGRLKIRNWESNGKHGTSVDIDADAIGHDLRWGTSSYARLIRTAPVETTRSEPGSDDGISSASTDAESSQPESVPADGDAAMAFSSDAWAAPMEVTTGAESTPF